MDGSRVRALLSSNTKALIFTYDQFESLVPSNRAAGSAHAAEDGKFVESLLRRYLRELLPEDLDIATGFILRPAVKTGVDGRERLKEKDRHSTQLDILVFDRNKYPVFKRFEGTVVVPPESVVAIISVKKNLSTSDIQKECKALKEVSALCRTLDSKNKKRRGPYLALVGMDYRSPPKKTSLAKKIFCEIQKSYQSTRPKFDDLIGLVGTIKGVSVFKTRPPQDDTEHARFICIEHKGDEEYWTLQLLLTGILSVFYDPSRSSLRRPGFSGFESGRPHDGDLGKIEVSGLR